MKGPESSYTDLTADYDCKEQVKMPVTRYTSVGGQVISETRAGTRSFYGADPQGSVVALYDATGTATDTFTYWPYGEVRTSTGSTTTAFKFCGIWGYYGDATGRLYVRARFYRDKLARWQTKDNLWPAENAYSYSSNSPVTYTDPSGDQTRGCPTHGGEPGCVYSGPPGSESDPAYWHCQTPYPWTPPTFDFWDGFLNWSYGNCCGLAKNVVQVHQQRLALMPHVRLTTIVWGSFGRG